MFVVCCGNALRVCVYVFVDEDNTSSYTLFRTHKSVSDCIHVSMQDNKHACRYFRKEIESLYTRVSAGGNL